VFATSNATQLQRLEYMQRILNSSISKAKPFHDSLNIYQRVSDLN